MIYVCMICLLNFVVVTKVSPILHTMLKRIVAFYLQLDNRSHKRIRGVIFQFVLPTDRGQELSSSEVSERFCFIHLISFQADSYLIFLST